MRRPRRWRRGRASMGRSLGRGACMPWEVMVWGGGEGVEVERGWGGGGREVEYGEDG